VLGTVGEHGILDVLSATRPSRLAILELKTVEDPVFLMQGAKYWLRVKRHLEQEDFPRCGFSLAPRFNRLHPSCFEWRRRFAFILQRKFSCAT
jgi:hypothetical protein